MSRDRRMNTNAELLLAGPRGRRMCLEHAMDLDQDISAAAFQLAYDLDPGKGTSLVRFGLMAPTESNDDDGRHAAASPEQSSPEELAAALLSLDASGFDVSGLSLDHSGPGDELICSALERAVSTAMYWQPPAGEDVLAALPIIREALVPLASSSCSPLWMASARTGRSEEHTSELQSLRRISYAVFCLWDDMTMPAPNCCCNI